MAQGSAATASVEPAEDLASYLTPSEFIDSDAPAITEYAQWAAAGATSDLDRALKLYYAVRDDIRYDPYGFDTSRKGFRASQCLALKRGFCITKAALLAACARAIGLPARVGYGDVRNHLATKKLLAIMGSDLFVFHGYTQMLIDGRWVKATPAFNKALCDRFGVKPLEFDGVADSLFHPFDAAGRKHMEYVNERGEYADVPFDEIMSVWREMYSESGVETGFAVPGADFHAEAAAERAWVSDA